MARKFTAAFFDRDRTLLHTDPAFVEERKRLIESWSGIPYEPPMDLFWQAGYPEGGFSSVGEEMVFWRKYWRMTLESQGVQWQLEERALTLFEFSWLKGKLLYPETKMTLSWFRKNGYRMGVISDTFPSLRLTVEAAGLGEYFDCYICSDEVGAMKPDRRMYQAGLTALGVTAEESLYVDDDYIEADGARRMGFTAFRILRDGKPADPWDITSLWEMAEYAERHSQ